MPARLADILFCLLGLATASGALISLFGGARGAGFEALGDMTSPAFFPAIGALALMVASVAIAIRSLFTTGAAAVSFSGLRPALILLALLAMTLMVAQIGFLETLFCALLILPPVFGLRDLRLILPTAIIVPLAVQLLFERLLLVRFPQGLVF